MKKTQNRDQPLLGTPMLLHIKILNKILVKGNFLKIGLIKIIRINQIPKIRVKLTR